MTRDRWKREKMEIAQPEERHDARLNVHLKSARKGWLIAPRLKGGSCSRCESYPDNGFRRRLQSSIEGREPPKRPDSWQSQRPVWQLGRPSSSNQSCDAKAFTTVSDPSLWSPVGITIRPNGPRGASRDAACFRERRPWHLRSGDAAV